MTNRRLLIPTLIASLGLMAVPSAQAGLLPVSVTTSAMGPSETLFNYNVVLPTDSQLRTGDFFTVYDFAGYQTSSASYVPSTTMPIPSADWSVSVANLGQTPPYLSPADSPAIPNITWTYTGPTIASGEVNLGGFTAITSYSTTTSGSFTGQTHLTFGNQTDSNITDTTVPVPGAAEPTTLVLAGLGLPLLALRRAGRPRKALA